MIILYYKVHLIKVIASLSKEEVLEITGKWSNIQFKDKFNYRILAIVLIVIFVIFVILIYINQININRNRVLKELVEERTKELQALKPRA